MSSLSSAGLNTRCVHAGTQRDLRVGAVNTPIHASSSFLHPNDLSPSVCYPRYMNIPVQQAVADKMAALESVGLEPDPARNVRAMALSTGMAAVSAPLLGLTKVGDHVVLQADLYGCTHWLTVNELPRHGVDYTLVRSSDPEAIAAACTSRTKVIYLESPSNPLLRIVDLAAVAAVAKACGATSVIDNTFASPINQTPLSLGFDVVVHSGTKYLGGHSDLSCGVVVGSGERFDAMFNWVVGVGCTLGMQDCALLERSLKTLALRMERHNANGMAVAEFLDQHPRVERVNHPGLPTHPGHDIASRQMRGFGAMLSFEPRLTPAEVRTMLTRLKVITPGISLGGVESLATLPAETSHVKMTAEARKAAGIADTLVRISVGIEDAEDIMADLDQALGI
ncbi:trans-sulfuration enzyme family protein [Megalodesulfovibrio paquesii]